MILWKKKRGQGRAVEVRSSNLPVEVPVGVEAWEAERRPGLGASQRLKTGRGSQTVANK